MEKFKQLGINEGVLSTLESLKFTEPSEIQEKSIPLVLAGKDVIGGSATGSGKTLAFGVGVIEKVKKGMGIQALIMTPTRELAEQVAKNIRFFSKNYGLRVKEIYGGVGMGSQITELKYTDVVVGTPGRILDHLQRRTINLSKVKILVLDEADRMLDMGFIKDVESIISCCPKDRQTLLFSATISPEISHIAERHMKNPVQVSVNNQIDPSLLYQAYYDPSSEEKFSLLVHLLKLEKNGVVMVFCNTRRNVDRLTRGLHQQGINAIPVHGGLSQNQRSNALQAFHEREALTLVCTDVAARGLDIKDVSHVYNFDIPTTPSEYIHRIGRTARAGKNGIAISFVCPGDRGEFKQIQRDSSRTIEHLQTPKMEFIPSINFKSNDERKQNRNQGNRGRGRSSHFAHRSGGGRHIESRPRHSQGRHEENAQNSRAWHSHTRNGPRLSSHNNNRDDSRSGRTQRPSRRFLRGKSKGSNFPRRFRR